MTNPIIIYGKNGQVGSALMSLLGSNAIGFSHDDADFSQYENIEKALSGIDAKAIINASGYTNVDQAESDELAAYQANATIPENLARYCKQANIPLVHYSTDYVFDGKGSIPHKTSKKPAPLNAYGRTKLAGEQKIAESGCKHLILRTSWVYDASGKNFLNTMLRLGGEKRELKIVDDQIGAPTYAPHLAKATITALGKVITMYKFPSGIYHLANSGETNWYEFAQAIFKEAKKNKISLKVKKIEAIPTSQYKTPALRPLNSRLDCSNTKAILRVEMPEWEKGLEECMAIKAKNQESEN